MNIANSRMPEVPTAASPAGSTQSALEKALLACGIGYGVIYILANDLVAASMFDGYSRIDQAISELSATGAPSRGFLNGMLPVFTLLLGGFGLGVRRKAGGSRSLRRAGDLLMGLAILGPLWLLFPMSSRDDLAAESGGINDVGHVVLGLLSILFILGQMALSAAALGKRFRFFAGAMAATTIGAWGYVLTTTANVAAGNPTPWMGFVERIAYGSWLLWMGVLAIVLWRRPEGESRAA